MKMFFLGRWGIGRMERVCEKLVGNYDFVFLNILCFLDVNLDKDLIKII